MYEFIHLGLKYEELDKFQRIKADWLEEKKDYSDNTKITYWKLIEGKIHRFEKEIGKDLYDFSKEEIIQLFKKNHRETQGIQQSLNAIVKKYIDWTYKTGIKTGRNPLDDITTKELFEVDELSFKEKYNKLEDFYTFISDLNCSDVDRAMLTLLRYGVNVEDVGKVKWDNVDTINKTLKVIQEDKKNTYQLELPIDDKFIEIINKAKLCEYRVHRTTVKKEPRMISYIDKGYIVKAPEIVEWSYMDNETVRNRIGVISQGNNIERIKVSDLIASRKYDLLFNILEKHEIGMNHVQSVLEIFDKKATYNKAILLRNDFELICGHAVNRLSTAGNPNTRAERKKTKESDFDKDGQKPKNNFIDTEDSDYQDDIDKAFKDDGNDISNHSYAAKKKKQQTENNTKKTIYIREPRVGQLALQLANFQCEWNNKHETFISNTTSNNYVEAHHLIPIKYYYSNEFEVSIDNEANIVALCPNCHRCLHYGKFEDKKEILKNLYDANEEKLKKAGIVIAFERLLEMYIQCSKTEIDN